MARLRLVGRPGRRFGNKGLHYGANDDLDPKTRLVANVHRGLRSFFAIVGELDEDEFRGFSDDDIQKVIKKPSHLLTLVELSQNTDKSAEAITGRLRQRVGTTTAKPFIHLVNARLTRRRRSFITSTPITETKPARNSRLKSSPLPPGRPKSLRSPVKVKDPSQRSMKGNIKVRLLGKGFLGGKRRQKATPVKAAAEDAGNEKRQSKEVCVVKPHTVGKSVKESLARKKEKLEKRDRAFKRKDDDRAKYDPSPTRRSREETKYEISESSSPEKDVWLKSPSRSSADRKEKASKESKLVEPEKSSKKTRERVKIESRRKSTDGGVSDRHAQYESGQKRRKITIKKRFRVNSSDELSPKRARLHDRPSSGSRNRRPTLDTILVSSSGPFTPPADSRPSSSSLPSPVCKPPAVPSPSPLPKKIPMFEAPLICDSKRNRKPAEKLIMQLSEDFEKQLQKLETLRDGKPSDDAAKILVSDSSDNAPKSHVSVKTSTMESANRSRRKILHRAKRCLYQSSSSSAVMAAKTDVEICEDERVPAGGDSLLTPESKGVIVRKDKNVGIRSDSREERDVDLAEKTRRSCCICKGTYLLSRHFLCRSLCCRACSRFFKSKAEQFVKHGWLDLVCIGSGSCAVDGRGEELKRTTICCPLCRYNKCLTFFPSPEMVASFQSARKCDIAKREKSRLRSIETKSLSRRSVKSSEETPKSSFTKNDIDSSVQNSSPCAATVIPGDSAVTVAKDLSAPPETSDNSESKKAKLRRLLRHRPPGGRTRSFPPAHKSVVEKTDESERRETAAATEKSNDAVADVNSPKTCDQERRRPSTRRSKDAAKVSVPESETSRNTAFSKGKSETDLSTLKTESTYGSESVKFHAASKSSGESSLKMTVDVSVTASSPSKAPKQEDVVAEEGAKELEKSCSSDNKGPRIKHVCRNAAVALGRPPATFPTLQELRLSALPSQEKERILLQDDNSQGSASDLDDDKNPSAAAPNKPKESPEADATKKITSSSTTTTTRKRGILSKWTKRSSGGPKKTLRCKSCTGCLTPECGRCPPCRDMPKNGGRGTLKHACYLRVCKNPILPWHKLTPEKLARAKLEKEQEAKVAAAAAKPMTKSTTKRNVKLNRPLKKPSIATFGRASVRPRPSTSLMANKRSSKFAVATSRSRRTGRSLLKIPKRRGDFRGGSPTALRKPKDKGDKVSTCRPNAKQLERTAVVKLDFEETTDIEIAWQRGLSIVSLSASCLRATCRLCGSLGNEELFYCSVCCEPFHSFCLEDKDRPKEGCNTWCCLQCQFCHVCYGQSNLLQCDRCQESYHPQCLGPSYPTKPSRRKRIWVCSKCVKCRSCGSTAPGPDKEDSWMCDFSLCQPCGLLMEKGNFCPVCRKCYVDDEWDSQMIQCCTCHSWVHSKCEELTDEMYQVMTYMPEDVPFNCRVCCPQRPSPWEVLLRQEMQGGMKDILDVIMQSKSSAFLQPIPDAKEVGNSGEQETTTMTKSDESHSSNGVKDTESGLTSEASDSATSLPPPRTEASASLSPSSAGKSSGSSISAFSGRQSIVVCIPETSNAEEIVFQGRGIRLELPDDGKVATQDSEISGAPSVEENDKCVVPSSEVERVCSEPVPRCADDTDAPSNDSVERRDGSGPAATNEEKAAGDSASTSNRVDATTDDSKNEMSTCYKNDRDVVGSTTTKTDGSDPNGLTARSGDNADVVDPPPSPQKPGRLRALLQYKPCTKPAEEEETQKDVLVDFHAIQKKLRQENGYRSIDEFANDVTRIIRYNVELRNDESMSIRSKASTLIRTVFVKQMDKCFPWFDAKNSKFWQASSKDHSKDGILQQACIPPSEDHTYCRWLEKEDLPPPKQPSLLRKTGKEKVLQFGGIGTIVTEIDSVKTDDGDDAEDTRCCVFCWSFGDAPDDGAGRLISAGQDDWVHVSCALWSAEVYEEMDGTLQMVHSALARSRKLRCDTCGKPGATVGCCQQGCNANFHFVCARQKNCSFLETKKVFCQLHWMSVDAEIIPDGNFGVHRRICVLPKKDSRWSKRQWTNGVDPNTINVLIGSLLVESLGQLTSLSDYKTGLLPVNYCASRLFWSATDPRRRCVYTCRVFEVVPKAKAPEVTNDLTVAHDEKDPRYDAVLAASFTCQMSRGDDESTISVTEDDSRPMDISDSELDAAESSRKLAVEREPIDSDCFYAGTSLPQVTSSSSSSCLGKTQNRSFGLSSSTPESAYRALWSSSSQLRPSRSFSGCGAIDLASSASSPRRPLSSDFAKFSETTRKMLGLRYDRRDRREGGGGGEGNGAFDPPLNNDDDELVLVKIAARLNEAAAKNKEQECQKRLSGSCQDAPVLRAALQYNFIDSEVLRRRDDAYGSGGDARSNTQPMSAFISNGAAVDGSGDCPVLSVNKICLMDHDRRRSEAGGQSNYVFVTKDSTDGINSFVKPFVQIDGPTGESDVETTPSDAEEDLHLVAEFSPEKNDCDRSRDDVRSGGKREAKTVETKTGDVTDRSDENRVIRGMVSSTSIKSLTIYSSGESPSEMSFAEDRVARTWSDAGQSTTTTVGTSFALRAKSYEKTPVGETSYGVRIFSANEKFERTISSSDDPMTDAATVDGVSRNETKMQQKHFTTTLSSANSRIVATSSPATQNAGIYPRNCGSNVPRIVFSNVPLGVVGGNVSKNVACVFSNVDSARVYRPQFQTQTMALQNIPQRILQKPSTLSVQATQPTPITYAISQLIQSNNVTYISNVRPMQQIIAGLQYGGPFSIASPLYGQPSVLNVRPSVVSFGLQVPAPQAKTCPQIQVGVGSLPAGPGLTTQMLLSLQDMLRPSRSSSQPVFIKLPPAAPAPALPPPRPPLHPSPPTCVNLVAFSSASEQLKSLIAQQQQLTADGNRIAATSNAPNVVGCSSQTRIVPNHDRFQTTTSNGSNLSKRCVEEDDDVAPKRISFDGRDRDLRLDSGNGFDRGGMSVSCVVGDLRRRGGCSSPKRKTKRPGKREREFLARSSRGSAADGPSSSSSRVLVDKNRENEPKADVRNPTKSGAVSNKKSKPEPLFEPHPMFRPHLPEAEVEEEIENSPLLAMFETEEKRIRDEEDEEKKNVPHLMFEISSDDGFHVQAESLNKAWKAVTDKVQDARLSAGMKPVSFIGLSGLYMTGLNHPAVVYLVEQLPGFKRFHNYEFKHHPGRLSSEEEEVIENPHGCIRAEQFTSRNKCETFSFLLSRYRTRPQYDPNATYAENFMANKSQRRCTSLDLPMAMRFRHLKTFAKEAVGVYRSNIHGRGLFCKRDIDANEMIVEYSGEVIRAILTDKREKLYEGKAIGCYMFRKDRDHVIDSTMMGNAARFINHSCEPNCYSKVILVDNLKHIVIFASRAIKRGEELTYDYKFPIEDVKIPCTCGSRRCRKYLN